MRKLLLQLALFLARKRYVGHDITLLRDYEDGGELEEVFTGRITKVVSVERIMRNGQTGYEVRVVAMGPNDKYGFANVEYMDMRKVRWNREKQRLEALKSAARAGTPSASTRPKTSAPRSSSRLQMGEWRGREP